MTLTFFPSKPAGTVRVPPSKSIAHRALFCAALANGTSTIKNFPLSQDLKATVSAISALGAKVSFSGSQISVTGIQSPPKAAEIDCLESGSTLRFAIPIAAALGCQTTFLVVESSPHARFTPT